MLKSLIRFFGYEVIKQKKSPTLDSHLHIILKKLDINYVIDVGANNGQFGMSLRRNGYKGNILSFEPSIDPFNKLQVVANCDLKWEVRNIGLSDKKETKKINIFEASDLNSIFEPSDFGTKRFKSRMKVLYSETIELDTLDNVLGNLDLENKRIFLKMDTQGYDLNVFKGAKEYIEKILGLLSEIPLQHIYKNNDNYHDILKQYESHDFMISGIFPVSRNKEDETIIELDCVMVKI
mgnify:CR=1 FL=1|tara:strand:- start:111 stop:818 length:708 start_codon:yes stop_codon:yes gene_type:complete